MTPFRRVLGCILIVCATTQTPADEVPKSAAHYFRSVGFNVPDLSPDGRYVATQLRKAQRREALALTNLATGKTEVLGSHEADHFGAVAWLDESNLFVGYSEHTPGGDFGMFRLDRETLVRTQVTEHMTGILTLSAKNPNGVWLPGGDGIVEVDGFARKRTIGGLEAANRIRSFKLPEHVERFYTQPRGEVRFCLTQIDPKEKPTLYWRPDAESGNWQQVQLDPYEHPILGVDATGTGVFIARYDEQSTKGLYRLDAATGTLSECLYRDDRYNTLDSAIIRYSRRSAAIKGIRYQTEQLGTMWLDKGFQQLQAHLDRQLAGAHNEIVDWSDDESVFLISSSQPGRAERHLMLDLRAKRLADITGRTPWVPRPSHALTERIDFTSRDGLPLKCYLTKPRWASANVKVPLVVHFGSWPWGSVDAGYDPMAQWLAANGLATLRVNPRTATGQVRQIAEKYEYDMLGAALDRVDALRAALANPAIDSTNVVAFALNANCQQALIGLADGGGMFRLAVMRDGHFRMRQYLDNVLKENRPLLHAEIGELVSSNPEKSPRFFHTPSENDLRNVKAQVVLVLDRPLPPGTFADQWSVPEGEYTDEANFLIRSLKTVGGRAEITRVPFAAFDADYSAFTMEEIGKVLFALVEKEP